MSDIHEFWKSQALELSWIKPFSKIQKGDFSSANISWFEDGRINACANCLDKNIDEGAGEKIAYYFEDENTPKSELLSITYKELLNKVSSLCWFLKKIGLKKGDTSLILLPNGLESVTAMLACARMGVAHTVVFAGFSTKAIDHRIQDCKPKVIITQDNFIRANKIIELASLLPDINESQTTVLNLSKDKIPNVQDIYPFETMMAEDPLFILYTSGSTGKPKGVMHTHGGYLTQVKYSFKYVFEYEDRVENKNVFFSTADVGWITGHSYGVYGPLMNKATSVLYSGAPFCPNPGRIWSIIDKYNVSHFYTAPTFLRMAESYGDQWPEKYALNNLKIIGSVGEPISPQTANWYKTKVAKNTAKMVDTWWQTETGSIMLTPKIVPGIEMHILNNDELVVSKPWPSMARSLWNDHERYKQTYLIPHPGYFFTGDQANKNDSQFQILGRIDDVININGHRLGTSEIESALVEHPHVDACACIGIPDPIKGESYVCFVMANEKIDYKQLHEIIIKNIGKWAMTDINNFIAIEQLPQTRSGKTMRRILRKLFLNPEETELGDLSTITAPNVVEEIRIKLKERRI